MGLFKISVLILMVAISTPLLYRQFATDNTIKFMSNYYSNYKVIDRFLKQSAAHLDDAKEYLPSSQQVKAVLNEMNQKIGSFVASKASTKSTASPTSSPATNDQTNKGPSVPSRKSSCPGEDVHVPLWTKEELAHFDGSSQDSEEVYLGFLGLVYNVSIGRQHYGSGAEYNVFAGKDATRAFVTGNFSHDLHDDIRDIDEIMFSHIESWASFYGSNYPVLGRIIGQFFDSRGCGTQELGRIYTIFDKLAQDKNEQHEQELEMPDCNSEWNGELKTGKVWCSSKSGGVERDWAGLPRLYNDGKNAKRCVCLNPEAANNQDASLEVYPGCEENSSECTLNDN